MPDPIARLLAETAPTTLVLCRTGGQAASLRRRLAARGGAAGILVCTPEALAAAAWPGPDLPEAEPPDTALLRRIGERPRLRERARELAAALAVHVAAGGEVPPHAIARELAEVADHPWTKARTAPTLRLLQQVRARAGQDRVGPSASLAFDAVYHLGFDEVDPQDLAWWSAWSPQQLAPVRPALHAALIEALRAQPLEATPPAEPRALPAASVPDPAAAARLAVAVLRAAAPTSERLVLVPDTTTAARLVAAGRRSGLWFADQEGGAFASHALADAVRQTSRWFASGDLDPTVAAAELGAVLLHPLVGRQLPKAARARLDATLRALDPDATDRDLRTSRNTLRRAIQGARIARAPLSAWLDQLGSQQADPDLHPSERRQAAHLAARLERLGACATGQPFDVPYAPDEVPEEADLVLDDAPPDGLPGRGTLGALRRFLADCGLHLYDDPIGMALRAALLAHKDEPATPERVTALLDGRAESDRLQLGVEILRVDDYDGRSTDHLVLLGVHDKGLSSRRAPDPFVPADTLAALGEATGETARAHALLQARRAAARSARPLAIAAHTDSTGRVVSAPLELQLDEDAGEAAIARLGLDPAGLAQDSYGRSTDLPEADRRGVLAVTGLDTDAAPADADPRVDHLRAQAQAEWCRHGRGTVRPAPAEGGGAPVTLADLLDTVGPLGPDELGPYLGELGPAPDGSWLPSEDRWSVSRHFTPLTNCLWRFLVERVLRVTEPEGISDELDPKEVGNSVHGAMEQANPLDGEGVQWRVPEAELEDARAAALDRLRALAAEGFSTALDGLGHHDGAIEAATRGLQGRWDRHWQDYVKTRIQAVEDLQREARTVLTQIVAGLPAFSPAVDLLDQLSRSEDQKGDARAAWLDKNGKGPVKKWLRWAVVADLEGTDLARLPKRHLCNGPAEKSTLRQDFDSVLRAFLEHDTFTELVLAARQPVAAVRSRLAVLHQPAAVVEPELPFGRNATLEPERPGADRLAGASLSLGDHTIPVSGAIDRVLAVTAGDRTLVELLDYKTGGSTGASALKKKVDSLELPQLPVYALVLQELLDAGEPVGRLPAGSVVAAWAYDFVREAAGKGLVAGQLLVEGDDARVRDALSRLVDRVARGSVPPIPLEDPERGPSSWGYPRGAVTLRDVSRFEELAPQTDLGDAEGSDDSPNGGAA